MISALAPDRPVKRSTYALYQGERNEVSRMRHLGAVSHENASMIWRARHSPLVLGHRKPQQLPPSMAKNKKYK